MRRRLKDREDLNDIIDCARKTSILAASKAYDVSYKGLYDYMKANGIKVERSYYLNRKEEVDALVLKANGSSLSQVARELNVSKQAVFQKFQQAGFKLQYIRRDDVDLPYVQKK